MNVMFVYFQHKTDTEFEGEVITSDGMTIGYLQQEPELDFDKNVGQNIMDGIPEVTNKLQTNKHAHNNKQTQI